MKLTTASAVPATEKDGITTAAANLFFLHLTNRRPDWKTIPDFKRACIVGRLSPSTTTAWGCALTPRPTLRGRESRPRHASAAPSACSTTACPTRRGTTSTPATARTGTDIGPDVGSGFPSCQFWCRVSVATYLSWPVTSVAPPVIYAEAATRPHDNQITKE